MKRVDVQDHDRTISYLLEPDNGTWYIVGVRLNGEWHRDRQGTYVKGSVAPGSVRDTRAWTHQLVVGNLLVIGWEDAQKYDRPIVSIDECFRPPEGLF